MKQLFKTVFAVLLAVTVWVGGGNVSYSYAAMTDEIQFDKTDVLQDLQSDSNFNILDYPPDESGTIKRAGIINVVEYCYTYRENMRKNYGLYLYFYNPQVKEIEQNSIANKVQIATSWKTDSEGNSIPNGYQKFSLKCCSVSKGSKYARLFYKFKVVDEQGEDGKTIAKRVNSNARRYDISGIELKTKGDANATEYLVGGSYVFSGYSKGYGLDSHAESDLKCDVRKFETIRLDLSGKTDGIDKRTYWRSNSSSKGKYYQNQINSVFFAVDKSVLEQYGYMLQKIKAEWWEYKTRPAVAIDDLRIYNALEQYSGVPIGEQFDKKRGWILHDADFWYSGGMSKYAWSWNADLKSGGMSSVYSDYIDTLLSILVYTGGIDVGEYELTAEKLQSYCESYRKSFEGGHLDINGRDYSADLFEKTADEGRTSGYNLREFDIANPDDYWDIRSYDSSHNWWQKLWDYGFGGMHTDDDYRNIAPIQRVTEADMAVQDLSSHLLIHPDDTETFQKFYDSVHAEQEVFLFRYAATDYWAKPLNIFEIDQSGDGGTNHNGVGQVRQGTQIFDFDVLELTFNKDGVYTVLPVVSSPIDHWTGYTPAVIPAGCKAVDWGMLAIVLLLFVLTITGILPAVMKGVVFILVLPFKGIAWVVEKIKERKKE